MFDYKIKATFSKSVHLALHNPTSQYVALKQISADKYSDEDFKIICEEIKRILSFDHDNIIKIHSVFVQNLDINVVYPFYCFGSCKEAMKNFFFTGFPEKICALIIKDVLIALDYLHNKSKIIHRSIRASHILLGTQTVILTGFRDSESLVSNGERIKCLHSLPLNSSKSTNWFAPELLEQNLQGYTEKSDVYSVGITSCELANGIAPFADLSSTLMLTEKIRGNQPSLLDCSTFPSAEIIAQAQGVGIGEWAADQTRNIYSNRSLSDSFHRFSEICMSRFPESRPNVLQLLTHAFFKQCKHATLEEQLKNVLEPIDFDKISLAQKLSEEDLSTRIEALAVSDVAEWDF